MIGQEDKAGDYNHLIGVAEIASFPGLSCFFFFVPWLYFSYTHGYHEGQVEEVVTAFDASSWQNFKVEAPLNTRAAHKGVVKPHPQPPTITSLFHTPEGIVMLMGILSMMKERELLILSMTKEKELWILSMTKERELLILSMMKGGGCRNCGRYNRVNM